eukprot:1026578-Lingulodinium_polyedra.AAC.1
MVSVLEASAIGGRKRRQQHGSATAGWPGGGQLFQHLFAMMPPGPATGGPPATGRPPGPAAGGPQQSVSSRSANAS